MKNIRKPIITILAVIVALSFLGIFVINTAYTLPRHKSGGWVSYGAEKIMVEAPTALRVSDGGIAVFYEKNGYAAVYDHDGSLLYALGVDGGRKGASNFGWLDGQLVICAKTGSVYIFDGAELTDSFDGGSRDNAQRAAELRQRLGKNSLTSEYGGCTYRIAGTEIVYAGDDGADITAVTLPWNSVLTVLYFVSMCACIGAGVLTYDGKRRKKESEETEISPAAP